MAGKNKNPNERYAIAGLVVAGIAAVAAVLLGLAKGMVAINMASLDDKIKGGVDTALVVSIVLVVVGLASYVLIMPDTVRRFLSGRQARYGSNSLVMLIAFLGIIVAVNYLAYQNPGAFGKWGDWTEDKSNTLAPETLQTLQSLPDKVKATAFYTGNLPQNDAEELLKKFKANSNGKFDYEFMNPDNDPVAARKAGVTGDGKILLTMGKGKEVAAYADETELDKALIRLLNPQKRGIYFLQGHGESSFESGDTKTSYATAKTTLESKNYTVGTLNLLGTSAIPEDAQTIIIAGPTKPVSKEEVALLKKYVDGGGSLIVMENPSFLTDFGSAPDPLADYLVADWGIKLDNDIVVDLENSQNQFMAVSWDHSPTHPITQNVSSQNLYVILPQARSVSITGPKENITQTPLIMTTQNSWGETEPSVDAKMEFSPGKDIQGPLNLAIAGEDATTKGRLVVFGNSLFAADDGFNAYGNGNIFMNSVDWAAEQENLLNINPPKKTERTFTPPEQWKFIVISLMSICVLPGLILAAGVVAWVSRRKRG